MTDLMKDLLDLNKFILSKTENMPFLCYALNGKSEEFFVLRFICLM